jgi:imidazolonepropionase-like amidohydrolase
MINTIRHTAFAAIFLMVNVLFAQPVTIFSNATIHTGNGKVIEKGYLVISQDKILDVGEVLSVQHKNAKVIDLAGKHIYPGLIALNNYAGLNEIDAVRATRDYKEAGLFNPHARALIAYNTDSKILPTFSFNGILFTQAVPQGGVLSGSSSLMKTEGWNWEDAVVKADEGIHLNWPEIVAQRGNNKKEDHIQERINEIELFFSNCVAYYKQDYQTDKREINIRFEAMRKLFEGKANLYLHVNGAKGIITAVNYFKQYYPNIKLVLVGAQDAWQTIPLIKHYNIPVILTNIHSLPKHAFSDVDQPFKTAAMLTKEDVLVAVGHNGSWEARNIMFNAGTLAAYGLTQEQALACITYNAAKILGIDDKIGSLQKGLQASFVVSAGDILDMKTSKPEMVFLEGKPIDLMQNHQYQLYLKYLKKYGISE